MIKEYFKNCFRWRFGRQHSGYYKMLLLWFKYIIPFDIYLLKFPEGSEILPHIDTVDFGKHYRINLIIKKSIIGGEFKVQHSIYETSRIKVFRPDIYEHSVSKIVKGERILLSFGFILK